MDEASQLRAALDKARQAGQVGRDGYPRAVRAAVTRFVRHAHSAGERKGSLTRRLGLAPATLSRWLAAEDGPVVHSARMVPVSLVEEPARSTPSAAPRLCESSPPSLTVVSPGGYQLRGLGAAEMFALFRELP